MRLKRGKVLLRRKPNNVKKCAEVARYSASLPPQLLRGNKEGKKLNESLRVKMKWARERVGGDKKKGVAEVARGEVRVEAAVAVVTGTGREREG